MTSVQSTARRRFDISVMEDGNIQVVIRMTGSERYIATIIFTPSEWEKVISGWSTRYAVQTP